MGNTKEKKSTKTLKGQLFGAVSMMVVAAIALGTSTYAWFVNNTTTEVEAMQFTVSTATSLQVAVGNNPLATGYDAGTPFTEYKNVIANGDINGLLANGGAGWTNMFSTDADYRMQPASISNNGLKAASPKFYKSNGKMEGQMLSEFVDVQRLGEGEVKKIPMSFLASSDLDVYFGKKDLTDIASLITPLTATGNPGDPTQDELDAQAEAIKAALRVAIVPHIDANYTGDVTPVIFQFDSGAKKFTNSTYNTDYSKVTNVNGTETATEAAIKTELAKIQNEVAGKYAAIKTVATEAPNAKKITEVELQQTLLPGAGAKYLATVAEDPSTNAITAKAPEGGTPLFSLKGDTARSVDVYIWLEGTDQDCISTLSTYQFNLALPFAGVTETPAP